VKQFRWQDPICMCSPNPLFSRAAPRPADPYRRRIVAEDTSSAQQQRCSQRRQPSLIFFIFQLHFAMSKLSTLYGTDTVCKLNIMCVIFVFARPHPRPRPRRRRRQQDMVVVKKRQIAEVAKQMSI
jgi:hypothetical protein